jgi:hypothetical protein
MKQIPMQNKNSLLGRSLLIISFCACAASLFGQTTNLISLTTFEADGRPRFGYQYHYTYGGADPGSSDGIFNTLYYDPNDFGLTNAMGQYTFDDTIFDGFLAANPGGGFGYGFGGGANFDNDTTKFISTNREDYIISFDCRVEGLQPGTTSANGQFQLRFDSPDDTIQPPDPDSSSDTLLQVNIDLSAGSNWTHYAYTLDQGGIGGGSEEDFALYQSVINNINFAMNWNNPDAFGYDGDNAIYLDNVRLDVIQRAATNPPPIVDIPILFWNFDDKPVTYNYAYTYSQNNTPEFTAQAFFGPLGVGDSNANVMTFDDSIFTNGAPAYAGAGSGFSGPMDATQFTSTNLGSYRLEFDYRVLGLDPSKTSTPGQMQLGIRTNGNAVLTLNFDVTLKSNWQTFSATLNKGANGGGSAAAFAQNLTRIDSVQPNFQITAVPFDYGLDGDNTVIVDNVRLVRQQVGLPPLTISSSGGNVLVTWSGPAKLQSAPSVSGPYTDVTGATSPYSPPATGAARFFRTQWVP